MTPFQRTIYELSLSSSIPPLGIEYYKSLIINLGIAPQEIVELNYGKKTVLLLYFNSSLAAQKLERTLKQLKLKDVKINIKILKKKDWQDRWKEDFKVFSLTKRFEVVPLWQKAEYKLNKRIPIYLDSSLAFGTGLHETTRFMAQFIEHCPGHFKSFLDIGTGTGILTLLALKCGAWAVKGIDISADAVKTARANLMANGCQQDYFQEINLKKFRTKKQYDFVAANLLTYDLIESADKIISLVKPHQYLAVSGISVKHVLWFKKDFSRESLRCLKKLEGKQWAAFLYQKRG